jgi:hypothetical protein
LSTIFRRVIFTLTAQLVTIFFWLRGVCPGAGFVKGKLLE